MVLKNWSVTLPDSIWNGGTIELGKQVPSELWFDGQDFCVTEIPSSFYSLVK